MITVITTIECKEEYVDFIKKELCKLVPTTLNEFGCITYKFYQDQNNPNFFHSFEIWVSQEEIDKHLKTKPILNFFKISKICLNNFVIREMKEICKG
ncbi:MAG: putative quinol monooxygenase [bacterium]